jgi:pyruvate dehydrogenase E2 component (dihydrolipoamide acetyltransferase)
MAIIDIVVPDIGDFDEVGVIELLVKPGDSVKFDQGLIVVESDKASMEIPSSHAGVVQSISVKLGDKVKQGSVVVQLEVANAGASAAAPSPVASAPAPVATSVAAPAPAPIASASSTRLVNIKVPDIGDFKDVAVIEVMVKVGDTVKVEQSLVTVESDKASMEIPSDQAGVVKEIKTQLGDKINIGDVVLVLEVSSNEVAPAQATVTVASSAPASVIAATNVVATTTAAAMAAVATPAHNPNVAPTGKLPHASPSIRKLARLLGVPLSEVKGTGGKGRITEQDIQAFTKAVMAGTVQTAAQSANQKPAAAGSADGVALGLIPWPKVDFTKFGPVERKDMSRIKKISGANLHRNWVMIPHVTNHDDADITDLEAFRVATNKENEKSGVKVTMLAFLIKACVAALKKFPDFNASLDGDQIVYKQYFHIGFAADTPNGLMVPVIKDCDKKGIMQISQEMGELAKKARDGKLSPAEMSGACFTISSLGGIGGRYFTPIINAPEVAILGVCKSTTEPVWDGKQFVPRLMLPLSLSWDHRVIDGAAAARFNVYLGQILADFRRIIL